MTYKMNLKVTLFQNLPQNFKHNWTFRILVKLLSDRPAYFCKLQTHVVQGWLCQFNCLFVLLMSFACATFCTWSVCSLGRKGESQSSLLSEQTEVPQTSETGLNIWTSHMFKSPLAISYVPGKIKCFCIFALYEAPCQLREYKLLFNQTIIILLSYQGNFSLRHFHIR